MWRKLHAAHNCAVNAPHAAGEQNRHGRVFVRIHVYVAKLEVPAPRWPSFHRDLMALLHSPPERYSKKGRFLAYLTLQRCQIESGIGGSAGPDRHWLKNNAALVVYNQEVACKREFKLPVIPVGRSGDKYLPNAARAIRRLHLGLPKWLGKRQPIPIWLNPSLAPGAIRQVKKVVPQPGSERGSHDRCVWLRRGMPRLLFE